MLDDNLMEEHSNEILENISLSNLIFQGKISPLGPGEVPPKPFISNGILEPVLG